MNNSLTLEVNRRLDDRFREHSEDSARKLALKLHNRRKDALHAALDNDPDITVIDWGETDDSDPHEFVELALGAAAAKAVFTYVIVPGVEWIGSKLAEKAIDTALGELAKALVAKLRPKQESKELLDIIIKLPDGTNIRVDAPDQSTSITIYNVDGSEEHFDYSKR